MPALGRRLAPIFAVLTSVVLLLGAGSAAAATASKIGWQFGYDKQGRTTSITDPAGKRTRIRYTDDANGRLRTVTRELPSGGKVTQVFDTRGRRERMIDGAGSVRFVYDRSDRLTAVRRDGALAIAYRYDTLGRVRSVAIGADFTVGYVYDFLGRPEKIETPVGTILYRYDTANGAVTRRLPNGIVTRHVYRPDGALERITHALADRRIVGEFRYDYRLDGLVTRLRELTPGGVRATGYRYDTAKRLVSASAKGGSATSYGYDRLGNLATLRRDGREVGASRYDWASRLVRHNGGACRHDAAGNLTSCAGDPRIFGYTDTGQLASVAGDGRDFRYRYDGDGYLVSREDCVGEFPVRP